VPLAAIEIVTLAFPSNRFNGEILPALSRLVENETIAIVDGVFVSVDAAGEATFTELDDLDENDETAALVDLVARFDELISEDDARQLASGLEPNSSAAILVFEHTWMLPLRDAIVGSGGVLLDSVRIPGPVVDEVAAAVADLER